MASKSTDRLPFLEGMRGLAALYVVLGHICSMADPSALAGKASKSPEWMRWVMAPFAYGHLAVAAFIVISGFSIQLSLFRGGNGRIKSLGKFYQRRARRILPPYYACLAISIAVSIFVTPLLPGMPFSFYLPVNFETIGSHLALIHNFRLDWMYKLNGVLWSIAIEAQLYLLFPLLSWIMWQVGRWAVLLVTSVAAFTIFYSVPGAMKSYTWFMPLFALGMIAATAAFRPNIKYGLQINDAKWLFAIGFVLTGIGVALGLNLMWTDVSLGFAVAWICYAGTAGGKGFLIAFLGWRPFALLGAFSYSLYLMHHPIQQIVYLYRPAWVIDEPTRFEYLLKFGLPAMIVGSLLFYWLFERPFMKNRPKANAPRRRMDPTSTTLRTVSK